MPAARGRMVPRRVGGVQAWARQERALNRARPHVIACKPGDSPLADRGALDDKGINPFRRRFRRMLGAGMIPGFRRLIVFALLFASAAPAWAQDAPATVFRSSVDLVSMAAIVRDSHGKIVSSLQRE